MLRCHKWVFIKYLKDEKSYRSMPVHLLIATACPWCLQAQSMRELATAVSRRACVSLLRCVASGGLTAPRYMVRAYAYRNLKWVLTTLLCYIGIAKISRNVAMEVNLVLVFIVSNLSRAVENLWRSFKGRGTYSRREKSEESCWTLPGSASMEAFCVNCIISLYISPCWNWILTGTKAQHKEADRA